MSEAIKELEQERERVREGWLHIGEPLIVLPEHRIVVMDGPNGSLYMRFDDFIEMVKRVLGLDITQMRTTWTPPEHGH